MEDSPIVFAHVVTFNNEATILRCLDALSKQENFELGKSLRIRVTDNASRDGTADLVAQHFGNRVDLRRHSLNSGFCGAHNEGVSWALAQNADYLLILNPDLRLEQGALRKLVLGLSSDTAAGVACPKLYRADESLNPVSPRVFDSTGMYITPAIRHFDRGSNELDRGQYDHAEHVFGSSGAAMLLRRSFLEDAVLRADGPHVESELFDNKFFAYREDADLAWRSQQLGWKCRYEPCAVGYHQRHVLPENRSELAPELNAYSVRNRFLLQANNLRVASALPMLPALMRRNLLVLAGVIFKERSSLPALRTAYYLFPRARRIRYELARKTRAPAQSVAKWFHDTPCAEPALSLGAAENVIRTVTILVVNFNSEDRLRKCCQALAEVLRDLDATSEGSPPKVKVCVVDNASHDDSVERISSVIAGDDRFQVSRSETNLGFSGGINYGAARHPADAYLILNPDTLMNAQALEKMVSALDAHGCLGAVAPILKGTNGEIQRGYLIREFPTFGSVVAELFYLHRLWPTNPWTSRLLRQRDTLVDQYLEKRQPSPTLPYENPELPLIVSQPAAACILVRGADFSALNGFDEQFQPAWFEDVDFCKRLASRGQRCAVVGSAEVVHEGGYAFRLLSGSRFVSIWYPNMVRYFRKHASPGEYLRLRLILPVALTVRALFSGLAALLPARGEKRHDDTERAKTLFRLAWSSLLGK
ncbi:MAG: glycosyltransferase family 2 protein [Bdellovibrionota bacterium]